ncbi:sugar transferase [Fimbriimonas ginsengisoli]|uniref:Undecaprenyl-phosphate galactose phosphotransferase n=1 Tax=Fimbriimonas ginsengisoli Gsoil 348 TaxID=661478 RepID=A0A068NTA5_FIMGI|nr:sugar transferase [Fimbriimonas ginsengisoli]AIE86661.1 Undecaprenyl-phosphate galactose phosphotransferase [Fimbriimonas ginsengisoli Gsoil 348]
MRDQFVPAEPLSESLAYRGVKRLADVTVALTAVAVFSPIFLIVSILIFLEDKGPILYRQPRIGRFGVPFWFYKFRSMRLDADRLREELLKSSDTEGAAFKMKNDPRVTRIGRTIRKFSIDEMPQLFSVLAGHMSIVGPRPHLKSEVATYAPEEHERLFVKPGLLCLREIRGRSHLSFEQWILFDLEYVQNRSLWLDAKIFLLAIPAVIKGEGAY